VQVRDALQSCSDNPLRHLRFGSGRSGREDIGSRRQNARRLDSQETQTLPGCNTPLQQEGADLIDDARFAD
jgi:hypothetical protein